MPAVLTDGVTWKQLSINPDDAQFLQTRQFQTSYSQAYELTRGARKKLEQADELFQAAFGEASGSGFGAWARHKLHSVRPWLIRIGARFTHTLKPSGSGFS